MRDIPTKMLGLAPLESTYETVVMVLAFARDTLTTNETP